MIRKPQASGFYPESRHALEEMLEGLFAKVESGGEYSGGVVPHAGYVFSGMAAAALYAGMKKSRTVVILGNDHYGNAMEISAHPYDFWETPLGRVEVDRDIAEQLGLDEVESYREHSIEVQLPFLQHLWGDFSFLPITVPRVPMSHLRELGGSLRKLNVPVVATTDLSHYVSRAAANRLDNIAIDAILAHDPDRLLRVVRENNISMCGVFPTAAALHALPGEPELIMYYTSGDVTGEEPVVGYASIGFK